MRVGGLLVMGTRRGDCNSVIVERTRKAWPRSWESTVGAQRDHKRVTCRDIGGAPANR